MAPVTQTVQQGQIIVDAGHLITAQDLETIDALGINASHLDAARLGRLVPAGGRSSSACCSAWVWRFRPDLWHRNNVLLLVGLMLAFATLALKVTAGRSILPFFVPTAAAGMLLAILLDAGAATVLMVVIAVLAGAVNGSSLELDGLRGAGRSGRDRRRASRRPAARVRPGGPGGGAREHRRGLDVRAAG